MYIYNMYSYMYVHTQTYSTQCIEIWQAKNDD